MSIAQAKGLIREFKWYHLGFCFFWAVTFVALTGPTEHVGGYQMFSFLKQGCTLAALIVAAVVASRKRDFTPDSAVVAGVILAAGSLMYYLAFFFGTYSVASVVASSLLIGGAQGLFFVMWQGFYASEGSSRTTVYIPLSAACSVVLCVLVSALPLEWTVLCAVIILPAFGSWTLRMSLKEIEPYELEPMTASRQAMLLRDMWKPVFCVAAIGFVWRIVGHLEDPAGTSGSFTAIMAGMSCATLAVSAIELFSEKGFDVLRVYQVLFPLVTGVFLLPTFVGVDWLGVVSACTMFGFEVVNLLLLITCAVYASRFAMHPSIVYALCVGPALAALLAGDVVGLFVRGWVLLDFAFIVDVLFVCIYVLTGALFLISLGRQGAKRTMSDAPASRRRKKDVGSSDALRKCGEGNASEMGESNGTRPAAGEAAGFLAAKTAAQEPSCASGSEAGGESSGAPPQNGSAEIPTAKVERTRDSLVDVTTKELFVPASGLENVGDPAVIPVAMLTFEQKLAALDLIDPLSQREREVAELVLHGNTVPAISRKLFISENTVRGHTKNIYRKLGIHSKQELIDLFD